MANTCDLTAQFCEMTKNYRGPGQISLSSLAALKESMGAESGRPSTTQPNNADRGETALPGISATPQHNALSGSGTRAPPTNPQIPQIPQNQPHIPHPAAAQGPWMPQPHTTSNPVQQPQAPESLPGAGPGGYPAGAGPGILQAPRSAPMGNLKKNIASIYKVPTCCFSLY